MNVDQHRAVYSVGLFESGVRGQGKGIRREAELYPDGWKDFISMGVLRSEYAAGHSAQARGV